MPTTLQFSAASGLSTVETPSTAGVDPALLHGAGLTALSPSATTIAAISGGFLHFFSVPESFDGNDDDDSPSQPSEPSQFHAPFRALRKCRIPTASARQEAATQGLTRTLRPVTELSHHEHHPTSTSHTAGAFPIGASSAKQSSSGQMCTQSAQSKKSPTAMPDDPLAGVGIRFSAAEYACTDLPEDDDEDEEANDEAVLSCLGIRAGAASCLGLPDGSSDDDSENEKRIAPAQARSSRVLPAGEVKEDEGNRPAVVTTSHEPRSKEEDPLAGVGVRFSATGDTCADLSSGEDDSSDDVAGKKDEALLAGLGMRAGMESCLGLPDGSSDDVEYEKLIAKTKSREAAEVASTPPDASNLRELSHSSSVFLSGEPASISWAGNLIFISDHTSSVIVFDTATYEFSLRIPTATKVGTSTTTATSISTTMASKGPQQESDRQAHGAMSFPHQCFSACSISTTADKEESTRHPRREEVQNGRCAALFAAVCETSGLTLATVARAGDPSSSLKCDSVKRFEEFAGSLVSCQAPAELVRSSPVDGESGAKPQKGGARDNNDENSVSAEGTIVPVASVAIAGHWRFIILSVSIDERTVGQNKTSDLNAVIQYQLMWGGVSPLALVPTPATSLAARQGGEKPRITNWLVLTAPTLAADDTEAAADSSAREVTRIDRVSAPDLRSGKRSLTAGELKTDGSKSRDEQDALLTTALRASPRCMTTPSWNSVTSGTGVGSGGGFALGISTVPHDSSVLVSGRAASTASAAAGTSVSGAGVRSPDFLIRDDDGTTRPVSLGPGRGFLGGNQDNTRTRNHNGQYRGSGNETSGDDKTHSGVGATLWMFTHEHFPSKAQSETGTTLKDRSATVAHRAWQLRTATSAAPLSSSTTERHGVDPFISASFSSVLMSCCAQNTPASNNTLSLWVASSSILDVDTPTSHEGIASGAQAQGKTTQCCTSSLQRFDLSLPQSTASLCDVDCGTTAVDQADDVLTASEVRHITPGDGDDVVLGVIGLPSPPFDSTRQHRATVKRREEHNGDSVEPLPRCALLLGSHFKTDGSSPLTFNKADGTAMASQAQDGRATQKVSDEEKAVKGQFFFAPVSPNTATASGVPMGSGLKAPSHRGAAKVSARSLVLCCPGPETANTNTSIDEGSKNAAGKAPDDQGRLTSTDNVRAPTDGEGPSMAELAAMFTRVLDDRLGQLEGRIGGRLDALSQRVTSLEAMLSEK